MAFFKEFVEPYFEIAMYSTLTLGVLLDLACWKYRKLATFIFSFECISMVLIGCAPINYGHYGSFVTLATLFVLVTMFVCHFPGLNIVGAIIFFCIIEFVQ